MSSHVPTAKKHKRKTFAPTAVVHERTEAPTAHKHHTYTPTIAPTTHFQRTDAPTKHVLREVVPPLPLNATLFVMDDFNHTDPPVPMPSEGTRLYSSAAESDSVYTNPGVYIGAMFLLPMVVLGAWIVQGRVRRRHYLPIPGDDFP